MKFQIDSHQHLFRNSEGKVYAHGLKKDASTKFTIHYGIGFTVKIYHELTKQCICKGPFDSPKPLVVAKDSCDPDECSIELTKIEDLGNWLMEDLQDFELYFTLRTDYMRSM